MSFTPDFGSVPDWVEALGTAGAFAAVAWTMRQAQKDREAEQATNVDYYVSWEPYPEENREIAMLTVINRNPGAINDVVVAIPWSKTPNRKWIGLGKLAQGQYHVAYDVLDPACSAQDPVASLGLLVPFIRFRDSANRLWQRTARGELKRLRLEHRQPGNEAFVKAHREKL